MSHQLNETEQKILLGIARETLEDCVRGIPLSRIKLEELPGRLRENGASFVTLTIAERLRGCIGTLEAYQPLAEDVQEHTVAATLQDFRFPKVQPRELSAINIEISVLTPRTPLHYDNPEDLAHKLRPGVDGVVLQDGYRKATFLPQVWEKLPDPEEFLAQLCLKMSAPTDLWRTKPLQVFIYQVQDFHE